MRRSALARLSVPADIDAAILACKTRVADTNTLVAEPVVVAVARASALRTVVTAKTSVALATFPIARSAPAAVARARGMAAVQPAPSYCAETRALEARTPVEAVMRAAAIVTEETRLTLAQSPNARSADAVTGAHKFVIVMVGVLMKHTGGALFDLACNARETIVAIAVLGLKRRLDALSAPAALIWATHEFNTAVNAAKTRLAIALPVNAVARALMTLDTTCLFLTVRACIAWRTLTQIVFTHPCDLPTIELRTRRRARLDLAVLPPITIFAPTCPRVHALAVSMAVALAKRARTVLTTLARGTVANTVAAYRVTSAVVTTSEQGTVAPREATFTKALRCAVRR